MNEIEAGQLVEFIAVFDNRDSSEAIASAWAAALHDIPLDGDVRTVVTEFYRQAPPKEGQRRWIEPHHIIDGWKQIRAERLKNFRYEPSGSDEDVETYLRRLRQQRDDVASGRVAAPSDPIPLTGGPHPDVAKMIEGVLKSVDGALNPEPSPQKREALARIAELRNGVPEGVYAIVCPQESCKASSGKLCKTPSGQIKKNPHGARVEALKAQEDGK